METKKQEKPGKLKTILTDFSQETTFHGIRYIADGGSHFSRRLLWTLVTLAALAGFFYFVIIQLMSLIDNPKAVNVEIIYTKALPFPAVTICNQNTFRASKAFKLGLYDRIEDTYKGAPMGNFDSSRQDCTEDDFETITNTRIINAGSFELRRYSKITIKLCKFMCLRYHSHLCNSFLYDHQRKSCKILQLSPDNSSMWEDPGSKIDIFRRIRCPETMNCDFDGGHCSLFEGDESRGLWRKGHEKAKENSADPGRDHTKIYGNYLYIDSTATTHGFIRLFTSFLQARAPLCLDMAYIATGTGWGPTFTVEKVNSRLEVLSSVVLRNTSGAAWSKQFIFLGSGLFRVQFNRFIISGDRTALDDVVIDTCQSFSLRYNECRESPRGTEYVGNISHAYSGATCTNWKSMEVPGKFQFGDEHFPDGSADAALNHCRNPDQDPNGPWCMVGDDSTRVNKSYCSIPYCACGKDQFKCQSGQCVLKIGVCDGVSDCDDRTDETTCKLEVTCNFEKKSLCGYETKAVNKTTWKRHKGRMRNGYLSEDHTTQSSKGNYLYLDSGTITRYPRERIQIASPVHSPLTSCEILEFYAHIAKDELSTQDSVGEIKVYKYTAKNKRERLLQVQDTSNSHSWQMYQRPIQSEKNESYWIVFEAILGKPYLSDMAIDGIDLSPSPTTQNGDCWNEVIAYGNCLEYLPQDALCNGKVDCNDYSDEDGPACSDRRNIICGFEDGYMCGYVDESNPDSDGWKWADEGTYATVWATSVTKAQYKRLASPWTVFDQQVCLEYRYRIVLSGRYSGHCSLSLTLVYPDTETVAYSVVATPADAPTFNKWQSARVTVREKGPDEVQLRYEVKCSDHVDFYSISLDDVAFSPQPCWETYKRGELECDFSGSTCNYLDVSAVPGVWIRDHDGLSTYLLKATTDLPNIAKLLSPEFTIEENATDVCITLIVSNVRLPAGPNPIKILVYNFTEESLLDPNTTITEEQQIWGENINFIIQEVSFILSKEVTRFVISAELPDNSGITIKNVIVDGTCNKTLDCSAADRCLGPFPRCITPRERCDGKEDCWFGDDEISCQPSVSYVPSSPRTRHDSQVRERHKILVEGDIFIDEEYADTGDTGITDLTKMYQELGHRAEDLIHSCSWGGIPCSRDNFTTQITDYGLCHTFNLAQHDNDTLLTARAGSSSGLRMILNIEQYEYMKGPHDDAGVKIFLHDHKEVPFVKDLGFVVAPGSHALVAVKLSKTQSLGPPWGSCGAVKLNYSQGYTYSACMRECETNAMVQLCGCRDSYMPGYNETHPPLCNSRQYLECIRHTKDWALDSASVSDCGCTEPCTRSVYETQLSYGAISNLNIHELKTNRLEELNKNFHRIQELNQRSNTLTFRKDIALLTRLKEGYRSLIVYVKNQIWLDHSSKINKIHRAFHAFLSLVLQPDASRSLLWLAESLQQQFDQRHGLLIRTLLDLIDNWISELRMVSHEMKIHSGVNQKENLLKIRTRTTILHKALLNYNSAADADRTLSRIWNIVDPKMEVGDGTRSQSCQEQLNNFVSKLLQLPTIDQLNENGSPLFEDISIIESDTYHIRSCLLGCLSFFGDLVQAKKNHENFVDQMIRSLAPLENIRNTLDYHDTIMHLQKYLEDVESHLDGFIEAVTSRQSIYSFLNPVKRSEALKTLQHFLSSITNRLINPINDIGKQLEIGIVEAYQELAHRELNMSKIFNIPSSFQSFSIFHFKQANIQWPNMPMEGNDEFQVGSVKNFIRSNPKRVLQELVMWYNRPIFEAKEQLENGLMTRYNEILDVFEVAKEDYDTYEKESTIDDTFIKKNFMAVDIYFAQLKYQDVKQIRAYTTDLFLSDVGGYLGLLLGGSAISLFEFFDLVLYKVYKWRCSGVKEGSAIDKL